MAINAILSKLILSKPMGVSFHYRYGTYWTTEKDGVWLHAFYCKITDIQARHVKFALLWF